MRPPLLPVWICVHLPHLNLQGHAMKMPRPLMVITLNLHPFHIIFLMCNRSCLILILTFQHSYSMKLPEILWTLNWKWDLPRHTLYLDTDLNTLWSFYWQALIGVGNDDMNLISLVLDTATPWECHRFEHYYRLRPQHLNRWHSKYLYSILYMDIHIHIL